MKVNPVDFILNENFQLDFAFYLISGNEVTLMQKVKDLIIERYSEKVVCEILRIKNIENYREENALFSDKKILIVNELSKFNEETIEGLSNNDVFILEGENSPKIKALKNIFIKRKDVLLFDCYEISKDEKSKILSKKLNDLKLKLDNDVYWGLIEKLDDKYIFLENEIEKIALLKSGDIANINIDKIITKKNQSIERLFFNVLAKNEDLVNMFNKSIKSTSDANDLYYIFKSFSYLIIQNQNEVDFVSNIPKYLFREKKFLKNIFNKFNNKKKHVLLNLLSRTELMIRKENKLSISLSLRFMMAFKKIVIS